MHANNIQSVTAITAISQFYRVLLGSGVKHVCYLGQRVKD